MQELIHVPPNSVTGKRCPMCREELVHVSDGKKTLWIDYASVHSQGTGRNLRFAGYEHECKESGAAR